MSKFDKLIGRDKVPVYIKMKPKPSASHLINYHNEIDYKYYICDHCGSKIKILQKKHEMSGGVVCLPATLTGNKDLTLALCNKCLNPALKEFEGVK